MNLNHSTALLKAHREIGSKIASNRSRRIVMETILVVAAVGWLIAGVNLLVGWNKEAAS